METASSSDVSYLPLTPNQRHKAISLCFLAAFITGGFGAAIGMVSPQVAKYYGVHVSHIVYLDILNVGGLLIGNFFSSRVLEKLGHHKLLVIAVVMGIIAQLIISLGLPLYIYAVCALVNGISIGFLVPAVSQTIVNIYNPENKSESRLSILNFFFSAGSCAVPVIEGYIIAYYSWHAVFVSLAGVYCLIVIAGFFARYKFERNTVTVKVSHTESSTKKADVPKTEKVKLFNFKVILVGFALICYVYIEYIVSYWFSPYLQEAKMVSVIETGKIIGVFWGAIAIFRLLVGMFVLGKIKPTTYIFITAAIIIIGFIIFLVDDATVGFYVGAAVLGVGCSALFPTLLGYGINQANYDSPKVTSFLIMAGSVGATLCLFTSAFLGQHINKVVPIYLGPVLCIVIVLIIAIVYFANRKTET